MRAFRLLLGIAVSLGCLWLAVRNVPFSNLTAALAEARYSWLILAVFTLLLAIIARAQLWRALLNNEVKLPDSFWSESIGYLFSNVLPLRMGDPARVLVMSRRSGLPIVRVATTAIIERLFDLITILLVLAAILPWMNVPGQVKRAGVIFGLAVVLFAVTLCILVRHDSRSERLLRAVCNRFPIIPTERVMALWHQFVDGITLQAQRRVLIRASMFSGITWALSAGSYLCFLRSFHTDATLLEATFMLVAVCLAVSLPSSPGFIGVFQWVGQQALVLPFGGKYDPASALAITLTLHLISYVFTSFLGVIGLSHFGTSFVQLRKTIRKEPEALDIGEVVSCSPVCMADPREVDSR